ncbi:hypothetical protein IFM53868_08435 [Aspergillus udagawae]|uniref:PNPLA domain-containing protein n=1 Tax=Aspergillus udagawae TaxID=91492 RepID=A0ABQ1B8R7_9EURO|nr:hypothetical protein IFM53868_08435 [Aspergillus udagawae]
MSRKIDSSWLEIHAGQKGVFVRDHGRLARLISDLPQPEQQYPALSIFLGSKRKDKALQAIFPHNNIQRTASRASIGLRCETLSAETNEPLLFADGDVGEPTLGQPPHILPGDHLVPGSPTSTLSAVQTVYSRLVVPFADLICIFAVDFQDLAAVAQYLVGVTRTGSPTGVPLAVRPKVIVVLEEASTDTTVSNEIAQFYQQLNGMDRRRLRESFSSLNVIHLDGKLPETIQYERLRLFIKDQQSSMQALRRTNWCQFTAQHLGALFQAALRTFGTESRFDLVKATRLAFPVAPGLHHHLAHFWEIGLQGGCSINTLARVVASALLMDHYVPGMMLLEPRVVFRTLYRSPLMKSCQAYKRVAASGEQKPVNKETGISGNLQLPSLPIKDLIGLVEREFIQGFHVISTLTKASLDLRQETLMSLCHELGQIKSQRICLYCLVRCAQHCQRCQHAICDTCAQLFGNPAADAEYRFTLSMCLLCLSQEELVVDVLPPTMYPTILAVDGGGVRGVIPLEYLILIQERLGRECKLRDLVDLAVGPSSGGLITLGMIGMEWDIAICSQMFDRLARRIFYERRRSALSWLPRLLFGRDSMVGAIIQWLSWLFHDGCYDARIFDASLREAFREDHRIFGAVGLHSRTHSRSKFGVVATSIAEETRSFVFGNFNAVDWFAEEKHGQENPSSPTIDGREATDSPIRARATAAAPFYFSTANLGPMGSFQDGGLKDNFAADIARRICGRIWPSNPGITRVISMGTGRIDAPQERSPQFRHVFRDGFLQRSYSAFMSQMDTTPKWLRMKNELSEDAQEDYLRFDVALEDIPCTIDNANAMDEYRNLVIRQPGSNRMAREAATALLVGRFYFTLQSPPEMVTGGDYVWCDGAIRCKGPVSPTVEALQAQHTKRMDFVTDTECLASFGGVNDICRSCGRYYKPVTLLLRHRDEKTNIYLRLDRTKRWRISGFPTSMSSLVARQKLESPFGQPDHGRPAAVPCATCDSKVKLGGRRGKRKPSCTGLPPSKRVCILGQVRAETGPQT